MGAGPDPAQARSRTLAGIACGIGAGALWGLVFLAPELVREFSPLQMTIGRYLCYGLIAARKGETLDASGQIIAPEQRRWPAVAL